MKKFSFILLIATVLNVANVFAQDCDYSGTTGTLNWCLKDGTLTISGEGEMPDYGFHGAPWYEYQESIDNVVVGTNVTNIGNYAFSSCKNLISITIPNGVTSIGNNAVSSCDNLTSIILPNSVINIGQSAFSFCSSLASIIIPNSVASIGRFTFSYCSSLTLIDVENGNNSYASENGVLFNKSKTVLICCPAGKTGTYLIPNSVIIIDNEAFNSCIGLTSIIIPSGVTSIGDNAFSQCTSLTSITIPNNVTSIGRLAFYENTSLTLINVESGNNSYASENGVLFDKSKSILICCPIRKVGEYVIPNSVITIGELSFAFTSLTSIIIPNGVTNIEIGAFGESTSLTSITIPNSVTSIGSSAFYKCTNLTSITIPNSVTNIKENTFGGCESLTSITIPNSVTSIEWGAFQVCTSLTSITVPNSVTNIGHHAFSNCKSLTLITNLNPVPVAIESNVFNGVNQSACSLEVSKGSVTVYQNTEVWKEFDIVGIDVSISETDNEPSLRVYPNPTKDEFSIKSDLRIEKVEVYAATGALLFSDSNFRDKISLAAFTSGVYIVKVYTDEGVTVRKVVKE